MSEKHRRGISLSVNEDDNPAYLNTPERKLLRAILERWMLDILVVKKGPKKWECKQLLKYHNPIKYLEETSNRKWSLNWILAHLYDDPAHMRQKIETYARKILRGVKIIGVDNSNFAGYNQNVTGISVLDSTPSDTFLHATKPSKTTIH